MRNRLVPRLFLLLLAVSLPVDIAAQRSDPEPVVSRPLHPSSVSELVRHLDAELGLDIPATEIERIQQAIRSTTPTSTHAFRLPFRGDGAVIDAVAHRTDDGLVYVVFRVAPTHHVALARAVQHYERARLLPIEGSVEFSFVEIHTRGDIPNEPVFGLSLVTEDEIGCTGFGIVHDVDRQGARLTIDIHGVALPMGICGPAMTPAWGWTPLTLPAGRYLVEIRYRRWTDHYRVVVSADAVVIEGEPGRFTQPGAARAWRYPRNSFALHCSAAAEYSIWCEDFRRLLAQRTRVRPHRFGEGAVPFRGWGGYSGYAEVRYFRYAGRAELERVGRLLREFGAEHDPDHNRYQIRLESWDGIVYEACRPSRCDR
jgi:hypothetical protein